jgi:hypothetical protein
MAGILGSSTPAGKFVDPKAQILYGKGNNKYTPEQIKQWITVPGGRTPDEIFNAALGGGISADQIVGAMKGTPGYDKENIDKHIAGKGVSLEREPTGMLYDSTPTRDVAFNPISVGSNETVQGQLKGILENKNSPLMQQAQTFGNSYANKRGMLDSSIGASAAESSMIGAATPVAQQDASTYYDAKKTNSVQDLQAQMFNSDLSARTSMFDKGTAKDLTITQMNNDLQRSIATMDSDNKLAIANIQAMASDSGIMGDLGKSLMNLYQQTAADPNIKPDQKTEIFNNLRSQFENLSTLLPSFQRAGSNLNFNIPSAPNGSGANASGTNNSTSGGQNSVPVRKIPSPAGELISTDYRLSPKEITTVRQYNTKFGANIDMNDVVPAELVAERKRLNPSENIEKYFFPVPLPGSLVTTDYFYIYKDAVSKYQ